MDFLKDIALPQSEAQIGVLHFVMNVIYILLLPFVSYLFGALVLSLYYHRRGRQNNDAALLQFSRDMIDHILPNKSILLLFGAVPYLALTFAFAQLLQQSASITVSVMTWGVIFFAAAAAFASSYQSSLKLGGMFASIPNNEEIESFKAQMSETRRTSGKYAVIFLSLSVYCLIAGASLAAEPEQWQSVSNVVELFFSLPVLVRIVQFVLFALTIASLGMLFFTFSWQGGKAQMLAGYGDRVRQIALPISLLTLLVQPLLAVLTIVLMPVSALGGIVFFSTFLFIFFIFLASHAVYGMMKEFKTGFSAKAFYFFVTAMLFVIIQTTSSLSYSTKDHAAQLAFRYDRYHDELLASMGISLSVFTGEDIYNAKCSACHEFGVKKVGPAYKDVLGKYENNRELLLSFVLNPQKIDPAYPPMPNQGLKPSEADSIAAYIMTMYKQAK